jgi:formiminotetrahydrofolate cyclodeaminase
MSLVKLNIEEFARQLASDAPAPGGGSVAALAGALAASLSAMVARLTEGKEKYRDSWEAMASVREQGDALADRLLKLVDEDTEAYNRVTAAFRLPKDSDDQKETRGQAIQEATKGAAMVPFQTLETIAEVIGLVRQAIEMGNPNCLTDAGVAAQLLRAGALGASYNVRINLGGLKDKVWADELADKTSRFVNRLTAEVAELEQLVEKGLG